MGVLDTSGAISYTPPAKTFGGHGLVRSDGVQRLLKFICRNGFEHHVAVNLSRCADGLHDAFANCLGYDTYRDA